MAFFTEAAVISIFILSQASSQSPIWFSAKCIRKTVVPVFAPKVETLYQGFDLLMCLKYTGVSIKYISKKGSAHMQKVQHCLSSFFWKNGQISLAVNRPLVAAPIPAPSRKFVWRLEGETLGWVREPDCPPSCTWVEQSDSSDAVGLGLGNSSPLREVGVVGRPT